MGKLKIYTSLVKSPCNLRNFFSRNSSQARPSRQRRTMPLAKDLLHPSIEEEKGKCKLKRLVQSPNSYFMDVKCPGCYNHDCVQPRPNRGRLRWMLNGALPTDWRQSPSHGRMLFPSKAALKWRRRCHGWHSCRRFHRHLATALRYDCLFSFRKCHQRRNSETLIRKKTSIVLA